jgi:protein tyrosine kinase modulator
MPEEFEDRRVEKPDWRQRWALVRRRAWFLILPFFGAWFLLWCISWTLPSLYRSTTLILIEQPTVSQQYVISNVASDLDERLESIKQQILSRTLLLRIIDKLNLYPSERARMSPDDLVERMRKNIDIDLTRSAEHDQLTAFNISYSADNPYVAQQVTTELTNILISENLEVREQQSQSTTDFLQSQLDAARQNLAGQEQRVREFKDKHLGDLPGQLQSNIQILSGLQSQVQAEQDALGRAKQQNTYLESLLGQFRSGKPGGGAAAISTLDQELDKLRSDLADLSSRYTDQHPDVRKVKEQIAKTQKLRDQMAAQFRASLGGPGAKNKPADADSESDYSAGKPLPPQMEVESQLKANQMEIANRQKSVNDLQAQIADYQSRLNRTPVREQELADITRDYDQSRSYYESLLAKKNQSELATNLEKQQQGEHFRMVDPPSLPSKPLSPYRFKVSCVGLLVGVMASAAATAGAEMTDDRIYDEKEFRRLLPRELTVEIPPLPAPEEQLQQQRKLRQAWTWAGVMGFLVMAGMAASYLRG